MTKADKAKAIWIVGIFVACLIVGYVVNMIGTKVYQ